MRKVIVLVMMLMITITFSITSFAETETNYKQKTVKNKFSSKWGPECIKETGHSGVHRLEYGFDTFAIKEDYAYAYSNGFIHRSKIKNANGTKKGPKKSATAGYSDLEIRHKGNTVTYYLVYVR